jgi:NADH-quinone oxidoreductase subunit K
VNDVPLGLGLAVAAALFAMGLIGVVVRRNGLIMLLCIEVMLNAAGLAFVISGARWGQADGQVMFIMILSLAAAEVAIGLGLLLRLQHSIHTLDPDRASSMRG